jgi:hypothetical protein
MRSWAASQGFYASEHWGKYPKIQLLTIADLLAGKSVQRPTVTGSNVTFKAAPRIVKKSAEHRSLFDQNEADKG